MGVAPASYDPRMPLSIVTAPYGPDAARALHDAVAAHKAGDPLTPVSVIVPTNYVGVTARRQLARGDRGPVVAGTAGIAAVTFLTVYRLAELLGAAALAAAGRRPVSTPVLAAAVRGVLGRHPGIFGPVAEHPATEQALVEAYRELSQVDAGALDALRRTGPRGDRRGAHHHAAREQLAAEWYDERDLMDAATDAVVAGFHGTRRPRRGGAVPPTGSQRPGRDPAPRRRRRHAGHRDRWHDRRRARRRASSRRPSPASPANRRQRTGM